MTNGPGSVMDLGDYQSVVVMGTDFWADYDEVDEIRLAKSLGVDCFGTPKERVNRRSGRSLGVPYTLFPRLRYCPKCYAMTTSSHCQNTECVSRRDTRPPRVVAACPDGHLEDFPWKKWIGCTCAEGRERLYLESSTSAPVDGSDITVSCRACDSTRNLQGALRDLRPWGKRVKCGGHRPWLAVDEPCELTLRGVMRGSTNVYFPVIASSLSIPPFSRKVHRLLAEGGHVISARGNWRAGTLDAYIQTNENLKALIARGVCKAEDIKRAFEEVYTETDERSIKAGEWQTLVHDVDASPGDDFKATRVPLDSIPPGRWLERVSRVETLREVVALRGFTRLRPAQDFSSHSIQKLRLSDEALEALRAKNPSALIPNRPDRNWLPGFELHGEGLFFEFKEELVKTWEELPKVRERYRPLLQNTTAPSPRDCLDTRIARTILVHTFSHLIIREISLACGYTLASIRERLYSVRDPEMSMAGVLIYTSTPDSEGSLGGLVAQAQDAARLRNHVERMLALAEDCVRGPLCTYAEPSRNRTPEGSSCYACTHLPETSCEGLGNALLDRRCIADARGEFGAFG